ncbi:MAG TPA: DUF4331 domain-containing protein [Methylomirabilota bacterium]|jgi:hypothetical protein|nr:DUF4331 domain-containing protein [Methylomirabilota bacterium]
MRTRQVCPLFRVVGAILAALMIASSAPVAWAASHREAPLIALDPTADITDVYFFRSWENPDRVVLIMNVIPAQEPSAGPNYFNFSDDVTYRLHLDTNRDGLAQDIVYQISFRTEIRPPFRDLPVSYAGVDPVAGLPPAITALDGPGSEGLGLRQRYTVTELRPGRPPRNLGGGTMFAVPSNIGPRTMPNYEALAAKGVYPLANGGRVFAGQRDETFYIDLGATFDTLNFRRNPPVLSNAEDANDRISPFGRDHFSGFNVNTIALEIPISAITSNPNAVIGMYASTSRLVPVPSSADAEDSEAAGQPVTQAARLTQVARMANPLVNELIIGTGDKDRWNATAPSAEAAFLGYYQFPRLAALMNLAFGIPVPGTPRSDLVGALLKYPGQNPSSCSASNRCSELLRLRLGVRPTPPAAQKRLGPLAHNPSGAPTPDPAGWPNGRRPNDDVVDLALRVVAGVLSGDGCCDGFPHNRLSDGVNFNIGAVGSHVTANGIATRFPFLPTPHNGRNIRHLNACDEADPDTC